MRPVALTFLVVALSVGPSLGAEPPPILPTAQSVRDLPLHHLKAARDVRLTGVVTFVGPLGDFVVHDATAGIYVHPHRFGKELRPGDHVTVHGKTNASNFSPSVALIQGTRLGPAPYPSALAYNLSREDARWLDAQWVEVCVGVDSVQDKNGYTILAVSTLHGKATVEVAGVKNLSEAQLKWTGKSVWVNGVCLAQVGQDGRSNGQPRIVAPSTAQIREAPGPSDPLNDPPMLAAALFRFTPAPTPTGRRVKVVGVVTAAVGDVVFVLDELREEGLDEPYGVQVRAERGSAVRPGDRVAVIGWVSIVGGRIELSKATIRPLVPIAPPPEPKKVDFAIPPPEPKEGDLPLAPEEAEFVRGGAVVREVRQRPDGSWVLTLQAGRRWLAAVLHPPAPGKTVELPELPPGTYVTLTGVRATNIAHGIDSADFGLLLRSPADIVVEYPPPSKWWTQQRAAIAAALLALLVVLAAIWVGMLRYRVRQQTEQLRTQLEHGAALQAQYKDLFDSAGDAVWVTDKDGKIATLNVAAEKLLKVTREEAVGKPIASFMAPSEADLTRASKIRHRDDPFEYELYPKEGPPVTVEVTSRVLPEGGVQTVARNVTERKKLQEAAQRTQKLEALGRMAGGVAHDFNNLLTVINGGAQLLRDRLPPDDPAHALAAEILDAGGRAAHLTRQLLSFSRKRFVAAAPMDLARAVTETTSLLRRLAGDEVAVVVETAPDTPWVKADAGLIEQILLNLTVNARDAMPNGGTLTIRTDRAADGPARLTVADTGTGMSDEVKARVFEPFFTTKEVGQGTGLGLATVYSAVQALGAQVRFQSALGQGTTFVVEFPAVAPPAPPAPESAATKSLLGVSEPTPLPEKGPWGRGLVAMIAEDDDSIRGLAQNVLEFHGLKLLTAEDGGAASELAAALGPLHLLITDVMLPGMSGVELARRLRADRPDLKVLFVSGYGLDEIAPGGPTPTDGAFLRKPFTPAGLAVAVRELLRGVVPTPASAPTADTGNGR